MCDVCILAADAKGRHAGTLRDAARARLANRTDPEVVTKQRGVRGLLSRFVLRGGSGATEARPRPAR